MLWLKLMNTDWGVILIVRDTKFKGVWSLLYREYTVQGGTILGLGPPPSGVDMAP